MNPTGTSRTPSLVAADLNGSLRLSDLINAFTRPTHAELNRLIMERLPLALPPYTKTSATYIEGLLHIAPIYFTFESLWQTKLEALTVNPLEQVDSHHAWKSEFAPRVLRFRSKLPSDSSNFEIHHGSEAYSRIMSVLSRLQINGLARSARLVADLHPAAADGCHILEEQLETISKDGPLAIFIAHIKISVERSPHILVAFAWVFYMALFSGGRVMRASLRNLYSDNLDVGLQFFKFDGNEDGEDIRREFKKQFCEVEDLLTKEEKEDIILEAHQIFTSMIDIILSLDGICGKEDENQTMPLMRAPEALLVKQETPDLKAMRQRQEIQRQRNHYLEVIGIILAFMIWYCFRLWRYPDTTPLAIASMDL